jgi:hypothetical protein
MQQTKVEIHTLTTNLSLKKTIELISLFYLMAEIVQRNCFHYFNTVMLVKRNAVDDVCINERCTIR